MGHASVNSPLTRRDPKHLVPVPRAGSNHQRGQGSSKCRNPERNRPQPHRPPFRSPR